MVTWAYCLSCSCPKAIHVYFIHCLSSCLYGYRALALAVPTVRQREEGYMGLWFIVFLAPLPSSRFMPLRPYAAFSLYDYRA